MVIQMFLSAYYLIAFVRKKKKKEKKEKRKVKYAHPSSIVAEEKS